MANQNENRNPHDELLLAAVHDIRALLRANLTNAQLLERGPGRGLDAQGQRLLGEVIGSGRQMETLLGRLSEFANAAQPPPGRPIPVQAAIQTALAGAPGVAVDVRTDAAADVKVHPAAVRMLAELLDNARKFQRGSLAVSIVAKSAEEGVTIEVRDQGIGIEAAALGSVFEPLVRLHSRDAYPGCGLGLAICRRLAVAVGGALSLESSPGVGTSATLMLPAM